MQAIGRKTSTFKQILFVIFESTLDIFLKKKNSYLFMDMANLMNGYLIFNRGLIWQYQIRILNFIMEKHEDFDQIIDFIEKFYQRVYEIILEEGYD